MDGFLANLFLVCDRVIIVKLWWVDKVSNEKNREVCSIVYWNKIKQNKINEIIVNDGERVG